MKQKLKQLDKTTWKQIAKDDPKDRIEVEVGDSKQLDFYPQVKIMRWDNECNYSIRLIDDNTGSVKQEGDKVIYDKQDKKIEFYEVDDSYKMVWFLKEKPETNKVEFTIQSKGLKFYYQPELTQEEIDEGAFRPENVVGSYAVYASEQKTNWVGGKEYKAGKFGHIYRPHLYDSNGLEAWGDLHIENGIYSVGIPQDFLDKAVYPIKSNDTFGYTTIGTAGYKSFVCQADGSQFSGVNGVATSMSAYLTPVGTSDVIMALYNASTLARVGLTNSGSSSSTTWKTLTFPTGINISAINYILAIKEDGNVQRIQYDVGSVGQGSYDILACLDLVMPATYVKDGTNTDKYSIYATYTAGGTNVKVEPSAVSSTFSIPAPTYQYDYQIDVPVQDLTFSHPAATITGDSLYSSTTQSLDFSIPTITVIVPFITPYNAFFKNIANGGIDLDTNTIRVALVTSDYTFDRDAHEYFDDITNEITGTGYTAKGTELTGKSVVESGGQGVFDANNASWSNASFTARGAVVYRDTGTASTSPLIYFLDFAEDKVLSEENFVLVWQDSGIINSS